MGAIRQIWSQVWGFLEKFATLKTLFGGGAGAMTSGSQWIFDLPLVFWLPSGILMIIGFCWVWENVAYRYQGTTWYLAQKTDLVDPYYEQGPHRRWQRATKRDLRQEIVKDRRIEVGQIFKKGSRVSRKDKQRFENCLIIGPAVLIGRLKDEQAGLRPFSKGMWYPLLILESLEAFGESDAMPCDGLFFQNCEFRDIRFRLWNNEIETIAKEIKEGKWVTRLAPDTSDKSLRIDRPERSGE